ncbi:hypothetical protein SAMN04487996_12424 [Dyadobacter soli]|uniref:Uncharacterized protein n=1 Tax=Dyadobacter soli TaxID=659014 RepID=A0A1G7XJG1_9BACT|nr:hypothetical protein [Dyadobacter soli]SDG84328.1 hypothetical protein SAMN04487996_12424 [Dyadobacter soli]
MEHSSAALFQILYQDETLFQLEDYVLAATPSVESVEQIEPPIPAPATVQADTPTLHATPAIPASVAQPTPGALAQSALPPTPAIPAPPPAPEPLQKTAPAFPALKHKVLVLTDESKQKEMLMSEALFLDNILKAVGHSLETSDVLNFSFMPGQDARTVLAGKKTNYFISFGVPLIKLHLDLLLVPYTPKNLEGIWFLLVDPLVVIEADRNLKKKLWQALQKMFEMS